MKELKKYIIKSSTGFSVIEILLCMVISSSVLIGSAYFLSSIFNKIALEDYYTKIHNYANFALSDIDSAFFSANSIDVSGYNNFNTIKLQTSKGKIKYNINESGIVKTINDDDQSSIVIGKKTSNQLYETTQENYLYTYNIVKFECSRINSSNGETYGSAVSENESDYRNSFYKINLDFELFYKNELIETIEFERKVFSPKTYIDLNKSQV